MLMKSPMPTTAGQRLAHQVDALFGFLWLQAMQFYTAIKYRRDIAPLADQDDHLLADIGLTRDDVRHANAQPIWRDPTETLRRRAGLTERNRRALAALTDDEAGGLSEMGQRARLQARRQMVRACHG
jgi:uncharacterized protein YjiS (DUF1127 family)